MTASRTAHGQLPGGRLLPWPESPERCRRPLTSWGHGWIRIRREFEWIGLVTPCRQVEPEVLRTLASGRLPRRRNAGRRSWSSPCPKATPPSLALGPQMVASDMPLGRPHGRGRRVGAQAKVVVVVPEGNWAYRTVTDGRTTTSPLLAQRFPKLETVETMRASLKDPDAQFDMVAPAQLLDGVARSLPDEKIGPTTGGIDTACDSIGLHGD